MKRPLLVLACVLLAASPVWAGPGVLIKIKADPENQAIGQAVATSIAKRLTKDFPCLTVWDEHDFGEMLRWDHARALMNVEGSDQDMANVRDAFVNITHLVNIEVGEVGGRFIVSARAMSIETKKSAVRSWDVAGNALVLARSAEGAEGAADKLAAKFVDADAYFELCPYRGRATVTRNTTGSDSQTEQYPVYCNRSDQQYKKTTSDSTTKDETWLINKQGKEWAEGTVEYHAVEDQRVREENGCYKCSSGREGGRVFESTRTARTNVQGLSDKSRIPGETGDDARVKLIFKTDGTYYVYVGAASKQGTIETRHVETAQGTCDNLSKDESVTNRKDIYIDELFGPFKGTPMDKVLKDRQEQKTTKAMPKETFTAAIEFEFSRK